MSAARVSEALATVAAYRGTDLYRHFVSLLEAVEDGYRDDLLTIEKKQLRFKQGAAAQLRALRVALLDAVTNPANNLNLPTV